LIKDYSFDWEFVFHATKHVPLYDCVCAYAKVQTLEQLHRIQLLIEAKHPLKFNGVSILNACPSFALYQYFVQEGAECRFEYNHIPVLWLTPRWTRFILENCRKSDLTTQSCFNDIVEGILLFIGYLDPNEGSFFIDEKLGISLKIILDFLPQGKDFQYHILMSLQDDLLFDVKKDWIRAVLFLSALRVIQIFSIIPLSYKFNLEPNGLRILALPSEIVL